MASTYIGLKAIEKRVMKGVNSGVRKSARQLLKKTKSNTPVLTDTLRGGEEVDPLTNSGPFSAEARIHTGPGANEYAIFVHQHPGHPGFQFMRNAYLDHLPDHERILAEESRKAL